MTDSFYQKYGPWAIVTGASSGIGAEFCRQLAAGGFNIVLVARRGKRLEQLSNTLASNCGTKTKIVATDISAPDFIEKILSVTENTDIGLLVNNAGFALTGEFLEHEIEDEVMLLSVNCAVPIILSHVYGNIMKKRASGGIINIASAAAFLPMPNWANYSASKSYLLNFSQALSFELRKYQIDVLALCPAGTNTEFSLVAGTKSGGMEASQVVKAGLDNLGQKTSFIPGFGVRLGILSSRFLPRSLLVKLGAKAVAGMSK